MSEPNKNLAKDKRGQWFVDKNEDAAIMVTNMELVVEGSGGGKGFVWIELKEVIVVSYYFSPNKMITKFEQDLGELGENMRLVGIGTRKEAIIAGYFNGRAPKWGMEDTDKRGQLILEWMAQQGLNVLNEGTTHTFNREGKGSIPGITMSTEGVTKDIRKWRVAEEETLSDHQYIIFEIVNALKTPKTYRRGRGWRTNKMDKEKFKEELNRLVEEETIEDGDTLMEVITRVCDAAMPRSKGGRGKKEENIYWWTEEIGERKKECMKARRRCQSKDK
ncbi:hypothetical protein NQ318_023593 [Aromia moschata]|uniref:Endonuclease/exonuclease/phosphatase domain-containing protein n=1 Tax=Aromia moschata TaxID=1265417 RepID=A0AAV8YRB5_9CUCU|nr:hypothetical protein NQ318_023593 [Aromia moschata]